MDILAQIKFSEVVYGTNIINGKRVIFFNENWLHIKFEDHSSMFSVLTTSSEDILFENDEYEVIMQFLVGNEINNYVSLYVGKKFEGGYGGRLFFTGKILEVSDYFIKQ